MRIDGLELRDSNEICVWWIGASEHRAVACITAAHRKEIFDRLLDRLPGARQHAEHVQASLSELLEPGRSIAVQARGFEHWIGLARPFALGGLDMPALTFTAAFRGGQLSLPLLTASAPAAEAFERQMDTQRAGAEPWRRFTVENGQAEPFAGAAARSGRAPQTELEGLLAAAIERERADRARMIDYTTGENRIRLAY